MKNLIFLLAMILLYSCSAHKGSQAKHTPTPKVYRVSQKEKDNQNFDLKQSKKIISSNIKHKESNVKAAEKKRQADNEHWIELNAKSKGKKDNISSDQAFNFYH